MNFISLDMEEVTVVGERGQIVIPKKVRIELGLKPKMLVVRRGDMVVTKKLNLEEERRELEAIFEEVDRRIAKYGEMTGEEIDRVIHDYRSKVADKGK